MKLLISFLIFFFCSFEVFSGSMPYPFQFVGNVVFGEVFAFDEVTQFDHVDDVMVKRGNNSINALLGPKPDRFGVALPISNSGIDSKFSSLSPFFASSGERLAEKEKSSGDNSSDGDTSEANPSSSSLNNGGWVERHFQLLVFFGGVLVVPVFLSVGYFGSMWIAKKLGYY